MRCDFCEAIKSKDSLVTLVSMGNHQVCYNCLRACNNKEELARVERAKGDLMMAVMAYQSSAHDNQNWFTATGLASVKLNHDGTKTLFFKDN
jgi:hypothetical protein